MALASRSAGNHGASCGKPTVLAAWYFLAVPVFGTVDAYARFGSGATRALNVPAGDLGGQRGGCRRLASPNRLGLPTRRIDVSHRCVIDFSGHDQGYALFDQAAYQAYPALSLY